jgi:hypothetical protein
VSDYEAFPETHKGMIYAGIFLNGIAWGSILVLTLLGWLFGPAK